MNYEKETKLLRVMGDVDEKYIEEASGETAPAKITHLGLKLLAPSIAAAAALVIGVTVLYNVASSGKSTDTAGVDEARVEVATEAALVEDGVNSMMLYDAEMYTDAVEAEAEEENEVASEEADVYEEAEGDIAMAVNPMTEVTSLEEARELSGISLEAPEKFGDSEDILYFVYSTGLVEVQYLGEDGYEIYYVRKAPGSEDISGDYNVYTETDTVNAGSYDNVSISGREDGWYLATWTDGGSSFAVGSRVPLTLEQITELVAEVK